MLGLPLSFVIRGRPHLYGELVDGDPLPATPSRMQPMQKKDATRDFTAREALRTPAFWLLSLGHGFALFVVTAVNVHAITHLKEGLGYTVETAALFIMLMTLAQIGGIAIGALTGDRFDKRLICAACMLMHMGGLLFLTYAERGADLRLRAAARHRWGLRAVLRHPRGYFGAAPGMILGFRSW